MDRRNSRPPRETTRRDGWTIERQLDFLAALIATRSVAAAAESAGMSRESAYRLRARSAGALFAALWDLAVRPAAAGESHSVRLADGHLARLLGTHFRRERGDFGAIRGPSRGARPK
jgi:hypothetical protein